MSIMDKMKNQHVDLVQVMAPFSIISFFVIRSTMDNIKNEHADLVQVMAPFSIIPWSS